MQNIIILLIIIGCAILIGRRLFRSLWSRGRESGCGCGCSGCGGSSGLPPSCPHDDKAGPQKRGADQGQAGLTKLEKRTGR
ncbi:virus attachment protein p12 family protein [bacterium BMS3Bbin14]|nr:virus attachment protein p12 family protein [bacterium BMS3Abin13]GBE51579.1 virus attachment protein p12 family protein [bacterium BMS3Bbin14]HDO30504.1 FeoB-associated Cys-rich membrane protein [Desulfobacteraceae bacterium]HDZ76087.1 FeoB-associated Cys-rich membrane protein [Desulfobacteraceae bacterium]